MAEVKRTYYASRNLRSECFVINGKKEGEYKLYFDDPELKLKGLFNYIDDKLNGKYIEYHTNGQMSSILDYRNDKPNGESKYYDRNGELQCYFIYDNDKFTKIK